MATNVSVHGQPGLPAQVMAAGLPPTPVTHQTRDGLPPTIVLVNAELGVLQLLADNETMNSAAWRQVEKDGGDPWKMIGAVNPGVGHEVADNAPTDMGLGALGTDSSRGI